MRHRIPIKAVPLVFMVTAGCAAAQSPPAAGGDQLPLRETLQISPRSPRVPLDGSTIIEVRSVANGPPLQPPVQWRSDRPETISVISFGTGSEARLTARSLGTARITATDARGATGSVTARVE